MQELGSSIIRSNICEIRTQIAQKTQTRINMKKVSPEVNNEDKKES